MAEILSPGFSLFRIGSISTSVSIDSCLFSSTITVAGTAAGAAGIILINVKSTSITPKLCLSIGLILFQSFFAFSLSVSL